MTALPAPHPPRKTAAMIRAALLLALFALPAPQAAAQSVAAQAGADSLSRRCRAAGGTPREAPGLVRMIELGGRAAAALDARRFACAGAAPVECGPFGCKLAIYFGGPVAVFETHVKAWRARGGRLDILRVGAYCAGAGESCSETYKVEGEGLTLAGRGEAKFATDPPPKPVAAAPRASAPRQAAASLAKERDIRAQEQAAKSERRPGRASTRGKFDATEPTPATPRARTAPTPVAPGAAAERRRKLDAAPYVP